MNIDECDTYLHRSLAWCDNFALWVQAPPKKKTALVGRSFDFLLQVDGLSLLRHPLPANHARIRSHNEHHIGVVGNAGNEDVGIIHQFNFEWI
jgi:hypothetical protein